MAAVEVADDDADLTVVVTDRNRAVLDIGGCGRFERRLPDHSGVVAVLMASMNAEAAIVIGVGGGFRHEVLLGHHNAQRRV